ncbi:hypothetical protein DXF96_02665 [Heyndrickxia coagulans]|nr:hypothetical protein DXF96_02665 [Heyndrickxia coagulans]
MEGCLQAARWGCNGAALPKKAKEIAVMMQNRPKLQSRLKKIGRPLASHQTGSVTGLFCQKTKKLP